MSFQHLRTVDGYLCNTYREVYQRLQLLKNDGRWDETLSDAVFSSKAHQIRTSTSKQIDLWFKYKDNIRDDILHQMRIRTANPTLQVSEGIYAAFILSEDMCLMMSNKALSQLSMAMPKRPMHDAFNQELQREKLYEKMISSNKSSTVESTTKVCI